MVTPQVLVIFSSQYGYTEQYARWIGEELSTRLPHGRVTVEDSSEVNTGDIAGADAVVVGGSDYGGFLTGAATIKKLASALKDKKLYFFSVSFSGLAGMPREKLDAVVVKNYGDALVKNASIYHYRGGLDHTRLSLKHKATMVGIRAAIAALPQKNKANRQMLESFEQRTVDYSDRAAVEELVSTLAKELSSPQ